MSSPELPNLENIAKIKSWMSKRALKMELSMIDFVKTAAV